MAFALLNKYLLLCYILELSWESQGLSFAVFVTRVTLPSWSLGTQTRRTWFFFTVFHLNWRKKRLLKSDSLNMVHMVMFYLKPKPAMQVPMIFRLYFLFQNIFLLQKLIGWTHLSGFASNWEFCNGCLWSLCEWRVLNHSAAGWVIRLSSQRSTARPC